MIIPLLANVALWWGIVSVAHRLLDDSADLNQTANNGSGIAVDQEDR